MNTRRAKGRHMGDTGDGNRDGSVRCERITAKSCESRLSYSMVLLIL